MNTDSSYSSSDFSSDEDMFGGDGDMVDSFGGEGDMVDSFGGESDMVEGFGRRKRPSIKRAIKRSNKKIGRAIKRSNRRVGRGVKKVGRVLKKGVLAPFKFAGGLMKRFRGVIIFIVVLIVIGMLFKFASFFVK